MQKHSDSPPLSHWRGSRCWGVEDVVGGVEGEGFAAAGLAVAGFLNASDFVVNVIEDATSLIGTLDQVAGFVVGVAAVEHNTTKDV